MDLEVRLPASSRVHYENWSAFSGPFPEGSVLAAFHTLGKERRDVLVMHKTAGGWSFHAFSPRGRRLRLRQPLCERCHQEAPADLVFGLGVSPQSPANPQK